MPAFKAFTLAVAGVAKRLSDVYGDGAGVINAVNDIPYRLIILSSDTADILVGDASVTTSLYGVKVAFSNAPQTPLGPFDTGPMKLSELYAVSGGSGNLHILALPF